MTVMQKRASENYGKERTSENYGKERTSENYAREGTSENYARAGGTYIRRTPEHHGTSLFAFRRHLFDTKDSPVQQETLLFAFRSLT